ncbi:MAG: beta-ketoacyl-ACP synthase III [Frankiaceae bacterium]
MTAAVLCGLGGYLPPRVVTNDEVARDLHITDEWIYARTGIRQRYWCDPGVATSDLAVEAGARALRSAGLAATDMVLLATASPDHQMPATAPAVAARLGMTGVPALDLNAACSGFVYALAVGAGLVRGGLAETLLVIGADALSFFLDPTDRMVRLLFGDGAGAVVLRRGDPAEPGALNSFDLGSDGDRHDFIIIPGTGSRQRSHGVTTDPSGSYVRMQGRDTFVTAVRRMTASSRAVLARDGRDVADVDRVVAHQANARILHALAEALGLPADRLVANIDRVGNTSAASIPLALVDGCTSGALEEGSYVLLTSFGAGLAWGSAVLSWPKVRLDDEGTT